MSRNPHATNLRHHKPKRIEDKREQERKREAEREALIHPFWQGFYDREAGVDVDYDRHPAWVHGWQEADDYFEDMEARECPTGNSAT